jgi:uncharacterized repeat protein (TIGR03803 family)
MKNICRLTLPTAILAFSIFALSATTTLCLAQTEIVLHSFTGGRDGADPDGRMLLDNKGNLYGTTNEGGSSSCFPSYGCGTVFELHFSSGLWRERVLHTFSNDIADGGFPFGGVVSDVKGNLYGTTLYGGCNIQFGACGTIFEVSRTRSGPWKERVIYSFTGGADGALPLGELVFDTAGNLYGVATTSGINNAGVVFELTPVGGGKWTQQVLHSFTGGNDGAVPFAGLAIDGQGNLYGTTMAGGGAGSCVPINSYSYCGTAFELSPPITKGGQWTETILHSFAGGSDGSNPAGGLVSDSQDNFYGTTESGGGLGTCPNSANPYCGTVFELSPPGPNGGPWTETVLYSFSGGSDGAFPSSAVVFDGLGNLYGTTLEGGNSDCTFGCGTVFKLTPSPNGWSETSLYSFSGGADGAVPSPSLVIDSSGNLYGVAEAGGQYGHGVVFEIMP